MHKNDSRKWIIYTQLLLHNIVEGDPMVMCAVNVFKGYQRHFSQLLKVKC